MKDLLIVIGFGAVTYIVLETTNLIIGSISHVLRNARSKRTDHRQS